MALATLQSRWRPHGPEADQFERLHERLGGQAWLIGRVAGQEFTGAETCPVETQEVVPGEPWFTRRDASAYGVVIDAHS